MLDARLAANGEAVDVRPSYKYKLRIKTCIRYCSVRKRSMVSNLCAQCERFDDIGARAYSRIVHHVEFVTDGFYNLDMIKRHN